MAAMGAVWEHYFIQPQGTRKFGDRLGTPQNFYKILAHFINIMYYLSRE